MLSHKILQRTGTTMVECAVAYLVTLFIFMSLIVGSISVFRYQEMASLAREGTRYASTHGARYRVDAGLPVGSAGIMESGQVVPPVTPYNSAPWTQVLWYRTTPTSPANPSSTQWANVVYDNAIREKTFLLDPADLKVWVGWSQASFSSSTPNNTPGGKVAVVVQYPVLPAWASFWGSGVTARGVSMMTISN